MNYELNNHKKSDTIKWIIAFTLIFALIIGVAASLYVNLAPKTDAETETTENKATEKDPVAVSGTQQLMASPMVASSGIRLLSASTPATVSAPESVTITATLTSDITTYNDDVVWVIAFKNPSSAWASGKSVNDYVTMTVASDTHSVQVSPVEAFGEPIVITATSADNVECSATCQLDYVKRVIGINDFYINTDSSYGTNYKNYLRFGMTNTVTADVEYGVGTVTPEIAIESIDFALSTEFQNIIKNNITAGAMTARSTINAIVSGSETTSSYVTGSFNVGISNLYNGGGDPRQLNNVVYNNAYNAETGNGAPYMGGKPTIKISVSYGGTEYQTYTYTHTSSIPFERGNLVLDTAVTNLTLDTENVAF